MADYKNISGDCKNEMTGIKTGSVSLIITSPPYADARAPGINPDEYVSWFMERVSKFQRVLDPQGTFILNIKERVVDGERHTYVLDLIHEMRRSGWIWTEEWIWHKKNCHPGKWPNRFRDAWERCLQFNLDRRFRMYQDAVMVPIGNWATARLERLSKKDKKRDPSGSGSNFAKNVSNWVGRSLVYPTNVLHLATECGNKKHSAVFPLALPDFFIKLFTTENELVLDPFEGSGTTGVAAIALNRKYIGIDILPENTIIAKNRLEEVVSKIERQGQEWIR